jgi:hypothetical protein
MAIRVRVSKEVRVDAVPTAAARADFSGNEPAQYVMLGGDICMGEIIVFFGNISFVASKF